MQNTACGGLSTIFQGGKKMYILCFGIRDEESILASDSFSLMQTCIQRDAKHVENSSLKPLKKKSSFVEFHQERKMLGMNVFNEDN